jgi:hypothetical protein
MLNFRANEPTGEPTGDKCYVKLRDIIERAKELLPLHQLIKEEDDSELVALNRCPFHPDSKSSFSIFIYGDVQLWKCHAGCGEGDQINYLEVKYECTRGEAISMFLRMAGVRDEGGGRFMK